MPGVTVAFKPCTPFVLLGPELALLFYSNNGWVRVKAKICSAVAFPWILLRCASLCCCFSHRPPMASASVSLACFFSLKWRSDFVLKRVVHTGSLTFLSLFRPCILKNWQRCPLIHVAVWFFWVCLTFHVTWSQLLCLYTVSPLAQGRMM